MTSTTSKDLATDLAIKAKAFKMNPKYRRCRSIIREFSLNTSTHGIPGIARSESIQNRMFWTVTLIAFSGIMVYFVAESIKSYFSYPTQTSISIIVENSPAFPAVSICNYSPFFSNNLVEPLLNFTNSRNWTNINDTNDIPLIAVRYVYEFFHYKLNNYESIIDYFFPLNSMLISCSYNDEVCNDTDFISFLSYSFGMCYTFNAKLKSNQSRVRSTRDSAGFGMLSLRLYAHSHQYLPRATDGKMNGIILQKKNSLFLYYRRICWYDGHDS